MTTALFSRSLISYFAFRVLSWVSEQFQLNPPYLPHNVPHMFNLLKSSWQIKSFFREIFGKYSEKCKRQQGDIMFFRKWNIGSPRTFGSIFEELHVLCFLRLWIFFTAWPTICCLRHGEVRWALPASRTDMCVLHQGWDSMAHKSTSPV